MQPSADSGGSLGTTVLVVTLVFTVLSTLFVLLRLYVRVVIKRKYGWDDGTIFIALVFSLISAVLICLAVNAGYGKPYSLLSEAQLVESTKWLDLSTLICLPSLSISKVSICLFLLRLITRATTKAHSVFLFSIIAAMALNAVIIFGYGLGQCHPLSKQWDEGLPGHCNKPAIYNHVIVATSVVNAFGDFALALFPTLILKDLQMQRQKKIVVISLMSFGVVCGALAVARTIFAAQLLHHYTEIRRSVGLRILVKTEEHVSIIVACISTLKPAFDEVSTRLASYRLFSTGDDGITPLKKIVSTKQEPSSQELGPAKEGSERANGSLETTVRIFT